ncbi:type II secretion system protein GspC [Sorangium sp. So ce1036]|uniref:type II secretion system protein GspC n=1 Tax=Sorangium sp. So ce1036 TaxID=3133328 RepID=UPI003F04497B
MDLDAAVKHQFRWIAGTMIAIAAYFQAAGVSHLIGRTIIPDGATRPAPLPHAALGAAAHDGLHATSAEAILRRNPFDSVTGTLLPAPGDAPEESASAAHGDPHRDPICDAGRVVLIAAAEDAAWSFAVIEGPDGQTQLRRLGGDTALGTLARIDWDRVWLVSGGARCQMRIGTTGDPPAPEPGPRPQAKPVGGDAAMNTLPPEIAARIRRVSATEFTVDRAAVDQILEQQALLMRSARVIPERRGDQVVGLKLKIKRGSLLETLGLESGDSLRSINGFDLTDPQKALEAYARLRTANHLSVAIERGGQLMTLDFNIR